MLVDDGSFAVNKTRKCFVSQGGRVLKSTIVRSLVLAAFTAIMPFVSQSANAQEGQAAGLVAVLDVAKVFKENQEFASKMDSIKKEADTLKAQITQQQEMIKAEAQGLAGMEVGSADRFKLEGELEQRQTALRTKARQAETQLLNREAQIYFDTYQKMQGVVESLAGQHGISLVLRFDSEQIDADNRAEVIKGVNRAVVYHRRLDLTNAVSSAMGPRTAQATTATQNK